MEQGRRGLRYACPCLQFSPAFSRATVHSDRTSGRNRGMVFRLPYSFGHGTGESVSCLSLERAELDVNRDETYRGEVAEWPIVQHWKCCVRVTGPGVRIPPSPFLFRSTAGRAERYKLNQSGCAKRRGLRFFIAPKAVGAVTALRPVSALRVW